MEIFNNRGLTVDPLRLFRTPNTVALLSATIALTGCWSAIGPREVVKERPDYNSVIQNTAMQQTFVNLIRARERQPTLFLDVSEVDVSLEFQGTANTSVSIPRGRGGSSGSDVTTTSAVTGTTNTNTATNTITNALPLFTGHDATIGGALLYQESPTIRYVPLQGQNLVAQISNPISVDAIAALADSGWPPISLLSMVTTKLTPIDRDFYSAVGAIAYLSDNNALVMLAEPSDPAEAAARQGTAAAAKANDSLVLYCVPSQVAQADWPPPPEPVAKPLVKRNEPDAAKLDAETENIEAVWNRLREIYGLPGVKFGDKTHSSDDFRIVIRSQYAAPKADSKPSAAPWFSAFPALRTRSALGVLRDVTHPEEDWDLAVFVDADTYEHGRAADGTGAGAAAPLKPMVRYFSHLISHGTARNFYVFDSSPYTGQQSETALNQLFRSTHNPADSDIWRFGERASGDPGRNRPAEPKDDIVREDVPDPIPPDFTPGHPGVQDYDQTYGYADRSDIERHFMIILCQPASETPYPNAFVSAVVGKTRYSIDADDYVTQNNFALLNQLVTIQAVAQNQTLTPTIGVGSH
jgi:hypothetical protein